MGIKLDFKPLDLITVNSICEKYPDDSGSKRNLTFYVPAYQRGYRWNLKEVKDLLLDINSFSQNDEGDKRRLNLGSSTDSLHSTIVKSNCTETLKNINTKFDVKIL